MIEYLKFEVYFEVLYLPIMGGWWSQNFKGPSLFFHWLSLATIDLVGDNREFQV